MPILARDIDIYPEDLLEMEGDEQEPDVGWWALYTLSRREKDLMRKLRGLDVPFYGPIIPKRTRSPAGRIRTSYVPLFTSYVFIYGDEFQRYQSLTTGCVSRHMQVVDGKEFARDLRQIHELILAGIPLTLESRLQAGRHVRIRSGPFRGVEGVIIRREGRTRLLVTVNFLEQGASMVLEDCEVETIGQLTPVG